MTTDQSPTRVRYAVVAVTALVSVLLYLDRFCISFTAGYIGENLGISPEAMGWVLGAFFFSYALAQVPTGWLSDRFGARLMLAIYILAWSLFTAVTGLATGLVLLLVARLVFGVAQAGAYPTAAGLIGHWVPLKGRGKANSIVALGGRVGGAAAPFLTAMLLVAYTPMHKPSQLQEADLLDLPKLGRQLQREPNDALGKLAFRFRERLSDSAASSIDDISHLQSNDQVDPGQRARVMAALNDVLTQPEVSDQLEKGGLGLSNEVLRLLGKPPQERSADETVRLNRLLLEAACPGTIRQLYGQTWREVLLTYGAVGLLVALAFWVIVRDRPKLHPWVNDAEAKLAAGDGPSAAAPPVRGIPWGLFLRSRNMWLSGLTQFGINFGWVFMGLLLPRYLDEVFRVPIEERATMAMVPLLTGCLGMFFGGRLTDWLATRIGVRWGRALPVGLMQFVCAAAFLTCVVLPSAWAVIVALSVVALSVDLGVPSIWAFAQDIGGRNVGGTVGWGNMWGNLGAAASPVLLSRIQPVGGWTSVFASCAIAFLVAGVAGLLLDASKPLDTSPGTSS